MYVLWQRGVQEPGCEGESREGESSAHGLKHWSLLTAAFSCKVDVSALPFAPQCCACVGNGFAHSAVVCAESSFAFFVQFKISWRRLFTSQYSR